MIRIILICLVFTIIGGCDNLEPRDEDAPDLGDDDDENNWDYPYYLVIGAGLSETLSVLEINADDEFSLYNDVQLTGQGINQLTYHDNALYAVCSLSHSVVIYDADDLSVLREVSVGIGTNPMTLSFFEDEKGFLTNFIGNTISYFDLTGDGELIADIPMPEGANLPTNPGETSYARPSTCAFAGEKLYCALSNLEQTWIAGGPGLLAVIDPLKYRIDDLIMLDGEDAINIYPEPEKDRVWIVMAGDYTSSDGFVGDGMVQAVDTNSLKIIHTVNVPGAPFEMVVNSEGTAYLGNGMDGKILTFDTDSLVVGQSINITSSENDLGLAFASALAIDGHGLLYAAEFNQDRLYVIDTLDSDRIVDEFLINDGPDAMTFIH